MRQPGLHIQAGDGTHVRPLALVLPCTHVANMSTT